MTKEIGGVGAVSCPQCVGRIALEGDQLRCVACGPVGVFREGVWDFVADDSYAETFATQWSQFAATQLDSKNGTTISRDRFAALTGWLEHGLDGLDVLDAGCGAGRYSEVALTAGANVTALDLSEAAYTARSNLHPWGPRLKVVRGDLSAPPLPRRSFDRVFSIGVLQHTADPLRAVRALVQRLRPGGELVLWMYERRWFDFLMPKFLLRRASLRMSAESVAGLTRAMVSIFTPLARGIGSLPSKRAQRVARAALPIASYWGVLPLSPGQQREWSTLDTYDWLTPRFDRPLRFADVRDALLSAGAHTADRIDIPGLGLKATVP